MRSLLLLLALTGAAPLCAQQLSDSEVLGKLDNATASEVRWILEADFFTESGYGIASQPNRSCIAYQRLLKEKQLEVFELLVKAESVPAICYGICGLRELAPDRLWSLLPTLITDQRGMSASESCIVGRTSPAEELLEKISRSEGEPDVQTVETAWQSYLGYIAEGHRSSHWTIAHFKELLDELPQGSTPERVQALRYINASHAQNDEAGMRELCLTEKSSLARKLCLRDLRVEEDELVEKIWKHDLDDNAVLDLEIAAARATRKIANWREQAEPEDLDYFYSHFWQLTLTDWQWLATHDNPVVRDAATVLRDNPITGWRADEPVPRDDTRQAWLMACLCAAGADNASSQRRARLVLTKVLREDLSELPLAVDSAWQVAVADELAKSLPDSDLLEIAVSSVNSDRPERQLAGTILLHAVAAQEHGVEAIKNSSIEWNKVCDRLWGLGKQGSGRRFWEMRFHTTLFIESCKFRQRPVRDRHWEVIQQWHRELAIVLVDEPRMVPVGYRLIWVADEELFGDYYDEDIARSIIIRVYEGDDEFLPSDIRPERKEEDGPTTIAEIYKRMKAALAKLQEE